MLNFQRILPLFHNFCDICYRIFDGQISLRPLHDVTKKHRKHTRYRLETKQRVVRLYVDEFKIDVVWWGMFLRTYELVLLFHLQAVHTHTFAQGEEPATSGTIGADTTRARHPSDGEGARSRAAVAICVRKGARRAVYRPLCWLATTRTIAHGQHALRPTQGVPIHSIRRCYKLVVRGLLHQKRYLKLASSD